MKLNFTFYPFFEAFKSTELLTYFTKLVVSHLNLPRLLFFLRLSDALLRNTIQAFLKHDHGDKSLIIMIVNKWLIINAMDLENIILFKDRIASDSLVSTSLFCTITQKENKKTMFRDRAASVPPRALTLPARDTPVVETAVRS